VSVLCILLGRDPVPPMPSLLVKCIENKVVMVTGAGGSIGSELCRQVIAQKPKALVLLEVNEYGLYKIEQEVARLAQEKGFSIPVYALLASVTNRDRIAKSIQRFAVDTIYHAAAYESMGSESLILSAQPLSKAINVSSQNFSDFLSPPRCRGDAERPVVFSTCC
jgi:FlaA1/EpsC-like NDP-sugar epimerase